MGVCVCALLLLALRRLHFVFLPSLVIHFCFASPVVDQAVTSTA